MNHTVHIKGESLRLNVYSSRLFLRRILHPKNGDVGYSILEGGKEVALVWNEQFRMWFLPNFAIETMKSSSPSGGCISA